jgi:hypothetical protein
MTSEKSFWPYLSVSESLLRNFWLGLLLLAFGTAIRSFGTLKPGDDGPSIRVMTTAEPLRSPSLSTNSNGIIPHDHGAIVSQPFDSSVFRSYLLSLLPPVLGASLQELESIFDDEFDERVSRFAAEGGVVIYVVKVRDEAEGECMLGFSHDLVGLTPSR